MDLKYSSHVVVRMKEREIEPIWIEKTISDYSKKWPESKDEIHYIRLIFEASMRELEVVVNPIDKIIITAWWN